MNPRVAYPFLTLSDEAVEATPWQVSIDGSCWSNADQYFPNWDSSCDIHIRRRLKVVREVAAADLRIPMEDLNLSLGVRIGTGQGRLPRLVVARHSEPVDWNRPAWEIEGAVEGRMLSMVLDLFTQVILATPTTSAHPLSPRSLGDRLWSDNIRIRLEGEEPRFPIETVDLREMLDSRMAGDAPWYLHWSPLDWNRDFHGAVRLYLNKNAPEFIERIENEDPQTLQLVLADIMSQICERLLTDADAPIDGMEPGSLAAQAVAWLRRAWPGKDLSFIRSVLEHRPGEFRSAFLALSELGEA